MPKRFLNGVIAGCLAIASALPAFAAVRVTIDRSASGAAVPKDFLGLSYEMELLLPGKDGKRYFRADNAALLATFKTLGVANLRVGGNTADKPATPVPMGEDVDSFFAFAKAADVPVIYTLRLRQSSDPSEAAKVAKYVVDKYGPQVQCLAVGNEPNVYAKTYDEYKVLLAKYLSAIRAEGVAPHAKFCGPSTTPGKAAWARDFAKDFAREPWVAFVSQHAYPGGSARKVTDPADARAKMLSKDWVSSYTGAYKAFVPAVVENGLRFRIEEVNSFFNGGAKDVSDTHAAALWALDYAHWWLAHGAAGINFHTGDNVAAADDLVPCRYAAFRTSDNGYHVHPVGYGMKAFSLGAVGKVVPAKVDAGDANVTAYATGDDAATYVTVINKEYGAEAKPQAVTIDGAAFARGEFVLLSHRQSDVSATSGTTLGGAEIADDAAWSGKWQAVPAPKGGPLTLDVPPASAAVVKLSAK